MEENKWRNIFLFPPLHEQSMGNSSISLRGKLFKWNFMSRTLIRSGSGKCLFIFPSLAQFRFQEFYMTLLFSFHYKKSRMRKERNMYFLCIFARKHVQCTNINVMKFVCSAAEVCCHESKTREFSKLDCTQSSLSRQNFFSSGIYLTLSEPFINENA